jgi:AraC-like DNA-binding protein
MPKIVFSSDDLPAGLDDRTRFRMWRDIFTSRYGACDVVRVEDKPFSSVFEFVPLGEVAISQHRSTMLQWERTSQHLGSETRSDFLLGFNRSPSPPMLVQRGREAALATEDFAVITNNEPAKAYAAIDMALIGVAIPQARLRERIAHADDLVLKPLDTGTPAAKHLRRYIGLLLAEGGVDDDPLLLAHVEATLVDLVVLALGTDRDSAEMARMRGLRAARLQEILAAIKAGFANPAFSVRAVAHKLGVSPRYVNQLLYETGLTLAERVLELRLQKARVMLADPRHDRSKIVEIAFSCGFNEVSHFNRCFRRRFGCSPTQYRGRPYHGE